jgi:PPOX class probable F420-dependent enzyme
MVPARSLPAPLVERLLATWPVARLATTAPDGRPHLVPVVFAWHEGALWSPIDGKAKAAGRALARERNLARDPRAALLLDSYGADWTALWWIRVDGRGEPCGAEVPGAGGAAEALRTKYPQYRAMPLFAEARAPRLVRLVPERITSWMASDGVLDRLRDA